MAIRWRMTDGVAAVLSVAVGLPLTVILFLGVVGYCCLEWLHETLLSGHLMAIRPMRTIKAKP